MLRVILCVFSIVLLSACQGNINQVEPTASHTEVYGSIGFSSNLGSEQHIGISGSL